MTESSTGREYGRRGMERGAALVLVLVLSTIALVIMSTVLYMINAGTWFSGAEKRRMTACQAARGVTDVIEFVVQAQTTTFMPGVQMSYSDPVAFPTKLTANNLSGYSATATSFDIDPLNSGSYDFFVDVGDPTHPTYRVFVKLIDKREGNTQKGYKGGLVETKTGVVPPDKIGFQVPKPAVYTFGILSLPASAIAGGVLDNRTSEICKVDLVNVF